MLGREDEGAGPCLPEGRYLGEGLTPEGMPQGGRGAEAFREIHMHFQKQTEVKINPSDFAGRKAWELWSSLAGLMLVGTNRLWAWLLGTVPPHSRINVPWGGWLQQVWGLGTWRAAGGGKAWALGPVSEFLPQP